MADEENKDGESKNIEFEGKATDTDSGEKHEFSGEMEVEKVTSIEDAPSKKEDTGAGVCVMCQSELFDGKCINADCEIGQRQWSVGAGRTTAKAAAAVAAPRAWTQRGRVD